MVQRIWDEFLTERDKEVFKASGYGVQGGFGERPALLVIDVNYNFTGDRPEPILDSIKRWPNSCGEEGWATIPAMQALLGAARTKGVPVIYTTGDMRADRWDRGSWAWKNSRTSHAVPSRETNHNGNEILPDVAPEPQDIVIRKLKPSGFYGTNMESFLNLLAADSVIIVGTTTSGCVRATAIDAFSSNYRVAIVEDACFDRSQASHAINLCDLNAKYADVVSSDEVVRYIEGLPDGLFDLPSGNAT